MRSFSTFAAIACVATLACLLSNVDARSERSLEAKRKRVASLMDIKTDFWDANRMTVKRVKSSRRSPAACIDGFALVDGDKYPCKDVDFLSLLSNEDLFISRPTFPEDLPIADLADVWGWLSPSGREITLVCLTTGLRFVDATDPVNPINLGYIATTRPESYWCDVKVYKNTAYIVKDRFRRHEVEPTNGIQVFDLTRLEAVTTESPDLEWFADVVYGKHGSSHNVVVNTETGFLYTVGNSGDDCNAGLHMIDISEPLNPQFAGCAGEDGYVHDAQCVVYTGPDARFTGKEICFGFDEDTVNIFDVTNKTGVESIGFGVYPGNVEEIYTHQGWLNTDMDILFVDDELDEYFGLQPQTRTFVFNISDLTNPILTGIYNHPSPAIDHNLYIWGAIHKNGWGGNPPMQTPPSDLYMYNANYESGMRIVDVSGAKKVPPVMKEVGYFDVSPDRESAEFFGSWSTYMHPSGVIAISGIERGLFFVRFRNAFIDPSQINECGNQVTPTSAPSTGNGEGNDDDDDSNGLKSETVEALLLVVAGVVLVLLVLVLYLVVAQSKMATAFAIEQSGKAKESSTNDTETADVKTDVKTGVANPLYAPNQSL